MKAVIDTNVLVSALWKNEGNAYFLLSNVINGKITPCYDSRIMTEYQDVFLRPKFKFSVLQVHSLIDIFIYNGESVTPTALPKVKVSDEDDRAFYEVAKFCDVPLVTGNLRHFPEDPIIFSLANFCKTYLY